MNIIDNFYILFNIFHILVHLQSFILPFLKFFQSTNLAKTNSYKNNFDYSYVDYNHTNYKTAALLFPLS